MKKLILTIAISIITFGCFAQVNSNYTHVNGYYKSNGTYVEGYNRTAPNNTNRDNYSTKPNTNPWTGEKGKVKPDNNYNYSTPTLNYETIKTDNSYSYPVYNVYEPQVSYPNYNSEETE